MAFNILGKNIERTFRNKDIMVTGGCGSVGSEIIKQLLKYNPERIRVLDNNESKQFHLQQKLKGFSNVRYLLGDMRDKNRLKRAVEGADIVFHAAALKHVPLCEYNPFEAVNTNVIGTQNLIEVARDERVDKFISISTDKAVNPINTMGATKLLSEKLVMNAGIGDFATAFACVRFGNVLNSDGSVIPIFHEQIKNGGPVTITSNEMTRFFMSMKEAVNLIFKTAMLTKGREIFILKMDSLRIRDLAEVMIDELSSKFGHNPQDIKVKTIGVRPGEKMHELLMTDEEADYAESRDGMFVLKHKLAIPQLIEKIYSKKSVREYSSATARILNKDEIKAVLKKEGVI